MDTDGDGVGDNVDPAPEDPAISSPADLEVNVSDTSAYHCWVYCVPCFRIIFVRRRLQQCKPQTSTQSMHIKNRCLMRIDVFNQSDETTLFYFPFLNGDRATGLRLVNLPSTKPGWVRSLDTKGKAVDDVDFTTIINLFYVAKIQLKFTIRLGKYTSPAFKTACLKNSRSISGLIIQATISG